MDLATLHEKTLQWSSDRGILQNGKITTQALKLGSEIGELMDNAAKDNLEAMRDDIGDCLVVLTNLASLAGTTLEECWEVAYNDIKDRKGFLNANGNFIKSTDANYEQLLSAFEAAQEPEVTIVDISGTHLLDSIYTYHIDVALSDNTNIEFTLELNNCMEIPSNAPEVFRGKTLAQFKSYLSTIGEVE